LAIWQSKFKFKQKESNENNGYQILIENISSYIYLGYPAAMFV